MKTLVAYFSASGVTKSTAEKLASKLNCDIYEIKPAVPYTDADLNWMDRNSRSSVEMKDKSSRPEIVKDGLDVLGYDRILLGYPVWWYTAPTIINTFLETYDFSGKKIIIWATSGGSGLGKAKNDLAKSTTATIVDGRILNNDKQIEQFIKEIE
ncbi:MAG: NAD(P)H-dependent oxidoreductase [Clostridia bacterium]|nr:NAD(P)H-dependent oxidoreductase [Clostridia bacterium]